jgi:glycosyltransferase involved in cell wall biosynthesis
VSLDGAEFAAHPDIPFGDLLIPNRESHNQMICTHADAITVLSKFQWTTIAPRLNLNQKPATAIARGVDNKLFYPQPLSIIPPVQFLAVGYLHPVKDYGTMLRAFQRISEHCDAQLTIAGKDYQEEEIQKLAADLGLSSRVVFEGHVPYERIPACYRDAHILLHTARYESYGMAVAEAMACGRLVCGTRVGLMADLSDTCCLTVPVGDHAALAEIVVNLIRDPERQASLRSNALEWSKAHPLTWTTGKFTELYQKVMTPARAR